MRIGSLCSGYGGLDMAVSSVLDSDVAWHTENDLDVSRVLAYHYPGVVNHGDLMRTDWTQVAPVDIITAGYPCQPFSGNGRREGTHDPRHLWPGVLAAIHQLRPGLVFLENVEDHLTLGFGDVLGDLAAEGFDAEWCVLRASDVGAPHGRPRLFVLATNTSGVLHAATEPRRLADQVLPEPTLACPERVDRPGAGDDEDEGGVDSRSPAVAWAAYRPAIERWERIFGHPAPAPVVSRAGADDLNPRFIEWAMGLPDGWVTDVPKLTVSAQLKALGNGVVPQQAALALRLLLPLAVAA